MDVSLIGLQTHRRKVMGEQDSFTNADVEQVFTSVFDAVGHGRSIDRHGSADVVLVRELVHHGRLSSVWIEDEREAGA